MFTILGADGKEYGPAAVAKIQEWIRGGRANLQTKAKRAGEAEWKTLGDYAEFAPPTPASEPPPVEAPAPSFPAAAEPTPAPATPAPAIPAATFTAPQPQAEGERPLASRLSRLGAQILDGLIACACALPGLAILFASGVLTAARHGGAQPNAPLLIAGIGLVALGTLVLMIFQIYLLSTTGQSLGKKMLRIRIVNFEDEGNPGFVKVFLLRAFVNGLIGAVPFVGGIYSLVDLCFIFREDQRCIHDLIAGTKVVEA